jgi:hypothetical protein
MHYTYAHHKPDGTIFYIGKGSGNRAYVTYNRTIFWKRIVEKYKGFVVSILAEWKTAEEAYQHEKVLIDAFRGMGHKLANIANGGLGGFGIKKSQKEKNNLSIRMKQTNPMDNPIIAKKVAKTKRDKGQYIKTSIIEYNNQHSERMKDVNYAISFSESRKKAQKSSLKNRRARSFERVQLVFAMREMGNSYKEISEKTKYSLGMISNILQGKSYA